MYRSGIHGIIGWYIEFAVKLITVDAITGFMEIRIKILQEHANYDFGYTMAANSLQAVYWQMNIKDNILNLIVYQ